MSEKTKPTETLEDHGFKRNPPYSNRSPCPALNTLANHGYISRDGHDLTFFEIVTAITRVYNFSYPLAIVLTFGGFITCGKISLKRSLFPPTHRDVTGRKRSGVHRFIFFFLPIITQIISIIPTWTLDLEFLSRRGSFKIAHDASFVHLNGVPSTAPDPGLLSRLLEFASRSTDYQGTKRFGLCLADVARFHAERVKSSPTILSYIHNQIALGECALTWLVLRGHLTSMRDKPGSDRFNTIPRSRLEQWFGEERLPEGWWDFHGVRPIRPIGLWRTRAVANLIGKLSQMDNLKKS